MAKENKESVNTEEKLKGGGRKLFKPGADPRRNTKGRPPGSLNYLTLLRNAMKRIKNANTGKPIDETDIVFNHLERALKHDSKLMTEVMERMFGKVPERIIDETPLADADSQKKVEGALDDFLSKYVITTNKRKKQG